MDEARRKVAPKPKQSRSFTFIDQKTHSLPKDELSSVRKHISSEASQRRRREGGREPGRSTGKPEHKEKLLVLGSDAKGDEDQSDEELDLAPAASSDRQIQRVPNDTSPTLNTYLAGGRIDSLGLLGLAPEKRRELELMDYIITVIWPGFCEKDKDGTPNPYPRHWLKRSSKNPALLHGFMYSSSSHVGSRLGASRNVPKLLKEQLYHQAEAVKGLREQLENLEDATPEDVADCVMTILCLATNQRQDLKFTEPDRTPFHPPLAGAAWLNIYGVADFSEMHWKALERLVKANHGLARLAIFGLPWVISYADILLATAKLQKPSFQLFDVRGQQCIYQPYSLFNKLPGSLTTSLPSCEKHGGGFLILLDLGFEKSYLQPFMDLVDFSMIVAAYYFGILTNPIVSEIAANRNVVQHQLLSLPRLDEVEAYLESRNLERAVPLESAPLYEACRLTALLYSVMVTFPIPRSNHVRDTLLRDLKDMLVMIGTPEERKEILDVCLWCLVVGGISALGKLESSWYVKQTKILIGPLGLHSWKEVEVKVKEFAWLRTACNPGAKEFWDLVMDERLDSVRPTSSRIFPSPT